MLWENHVYILGTGGPCLWSVAVVSACTSRDSLVYLSPRLVYLLVTRMVRSLTVAPALVYAFPIFQDDIPIGPDPAN